MLRSLVGSVGVTVMYISAWAGSFVLKRTWLPLNFAFCVAGKHAMELLDAHDRSAIGLPDSSLPVTRTVLLGSDRMAATPTGQSASAPLPNTTIAPPRKTPNRFRIVCISCRSFFRFKPSPRGPCLPPDHRRADT